MTGHRISCQKSKFPLSLLFNQIFSSQYAVLLFAEQFSPTFFLMKCFFFNYRYSSLRLVPAYNKFIQERFERCLDLYLCPRQRKMRVSLIKKNKGIHLLLGLFCNQFSSLDYNTVVDFKKPQRLNVSNAKMKAVCRSNKTLINDKYMYHNHICLFKVTTYCSLKCTLWSSQQNTINIVFLTNVQYCSLFFRSK